jgi:hypothetical protein
LQLRKDIDELQGLLQKTTRQRATNVLTVELKKAETELSNLLQEAEAAERKAGAAKESSSSRVYTTKIRNYGKG